MTRFILRGLAAALLVLATSAALIAQTEPRMNPRTAQQLDVPVQVVTDTVTYADHNVDICALEDDGIFFGASDESYDIEFGCAYSRPGNISYNPRNGRSPMSFRAINFVQGDLTHIQMWVGPLKTDVDGRLRFSLNTTRDFSDYSGYPEYMGYDLQIRLVSQAQDTFLVYTRDLHTNGQPQWQSFVATLVPGEYYLLLDDWDPRATDWGTALDLDELFAQRAHYNVSRDDKPSNAGSNLRVWPNPSRGQVQYEINLDQPGHLEMTLYNSVGQQVAVLADGQVSAGRYTQRVDHLDLPAGVYLLRAQLPDGTVTTRSLTVVR